MAAKQRTFLLTAAGLADLSCFILGSFGFGDTWSAAGAIGLMVWLALVELTR